VVDGKRSWQLLVVRSHHTSSLMLGLVESVYRGGVSKKDGALRGGQIVADPLPAAATKTLHVVLLNPSATSDSLYDCSGRSPVLKVDPLDPNGSLVTQISPKHFEVIETPLGNSRSFVTEAWLCCDVLSGLFCLSWLIYDSLLSY
jgi:hypothetical protein